jgi:hypothetical protein
MAVRNPSVLGPLGTEFEMIIIIMGEEHAALCVSVGELNRVTRTKESGPLRGRHIDSSAAEALGDHWVNVFVKMEANRPWHPLP